MSTDYQPLLTEAQCDGLACVVCEADHRSMIPVPEVETRLSTHVFACARPECATTPAEVRARIPRAQRVA
jgi:hypothetical protein